MTRLLVSFGLLLTVGLAGCEILGGGSGVGDGDGEFIWVAQDFTGGRQCDPHVPFDPPDTGQQLEDAGVRVIETAVEMHALCEACHCPDYSATHFARIPVSDLDAARIEGYVVSDSPGVPG